MKIFLSAVSAQFTACRDALRSDLQTIGCEVKVQENFQQGPRTLIERLEEYVAHCERVIALVGDAYGCEASGVAVPAVSPPRSYTQWEYFFTVGERIDGSGAPRKDLYVYFASEQFLREHPVPQPADHAERQQRFCEHIKATGKHWASFDSVDHLCRLVLRDGWQMTERPRKPRNLPYDSIGTLFKGRETFLDDLHNRLQRKPTQAAAIVSKQAIHGLGGVGKTRLAVEYALRYEAEYSALLFVSADTAEGLRRNLAALCGSQVLNLPEQEATEDDERIDAALRWLQDHAGWFLILDNVDTPDAAAEVERHLAKLQGGHVLITSRLSDWSGSVEALELDVLSEDDSVAFLLEKTAARRPAMPSDGADARALAKELDGLALALEQAGAFVNTRRVSLADYLRRWREQDAKVREWHDERLMKYPRSVAVTWDATVDQLDAPALALLRILCWFAPEAIPREMLETEAAQQELAAGVEAAHAAGGLPQPEPAQAEVEDALAALASLSLVKWERGNEAFRMHRLVGEVTRERLPVDQRQSSLRAALVVVNSYLPDDLSPQDVRSWPRWEPMQPHVAGLIALGEAAGIAEPTGRLMSSLGLLLRMKCIWREAEPLLRRTLALDEERYGRGHPVTATNLTNLASLLRATNRFDEAELLLRRALAIDEQRYGPEHLDVGIDLNNLASLLQTTNRLAEAEPLMRRVVEILEKSLGANHPDVAIALSNLASFLRATKRCEEAEPLLLRALAIDEEHLGPEHPAVARVLNSLAQVLQDTNRLDEAEAMMRRALLIDEKSYGEDHPNFGAPLNNLAQLLVTTNRVEEAEPMMRRSLEIFFQFTAATGHEHPHLRDAIANYTDLLKQKGCSPEEMSAQLDDVVHPFGVRLGS
jgi:tetratricopeptide (TPR) repeat protein